MSYANDDLRSINAAHDRWLDSEPEARIVHRCCNCDEPIFEGYEYCEAGGNVYCHRCYSIKDAYEN